LFLESGKAVPIEYWNSPAGLQRRLDMLGEGFTFQLVNNALQAYGNANGAWGWEWTGYLDERVCQICEPRIGTRYRQGMFLPNLPVHNLCRCTFEIIMNP